eukprot:RCo003580
MVHGTLEETNSQHKINHKNESNSRQAVHKKQDQREKGPMQTKMIHKSPAMQVASTQKGGATNHRELEQPITGNQEQNSLQNAAKNTKTKNERKHKTQNTPHPTSVDCSYTKEETQHFQHFSYQEAEEKPSLEPQTAPQCEPASTESDRLPPWSSHSSHSHSPRLQ